MAMPQQLQVDSNKLAGDNEVSSQMQSRLIEMVNQNGLSIYHASTVLNIKHSVAKVIVRRYRSQHACPLKKKKTLKRQTRHKLAPRLKEKMIQVPNQIEKKQEVPQRNQEGVQDILENRYYIFTNYYFDPLTTITLISSQTISSTTNDIY